MPKPKYSTSHRPAHYLKRLAFGKYSCPCLQASHLMVRAGMFRSRLIVPIDHVLPDVWLSVWGSTGVAAYEEIPTRTIVKVLVCFGSKYFVLCNQVA